MKFNLETTIARVGTHPDAESAGLSPSIHLATTFARDEHGEHPAGYLYSRISNPTRNKLEEALAELEGGASGMAFSSGMAAVNAIFQALGPGDRILLPHDIYYGVRKLAEEHFSTWGLKVDQVNMADEKALTEALSSKTALVWIETPSNPQLNITDIEHVCKVAHAAGARVVVDNTWSTPVITRPFEWGADIVMHSITKYFGGHSDVLGGALICNQNDGLTQKLRSIQQGAGAVLDPFSAWLTMRGIRSLGARLSRQCDSAELIATFLSEHPFIERVHFPGLASDPGHEVATKQMNRYGAMLSCRIKGTAGQAKKVASSLTLFANATSLGGTESLIEHRASVEGPYSTTPSNLLRISVGLESAQDLLDDLDSTLRSILG
ncbi:aminotransferase class I/II-fold pyridoxal phosphate-dependent enzyme [bacterium]|nr:aminotransferase class I/II-fold pyridoxal phosphate-dependent enzyme [bacterium]